MKGYKKDWKEYAKEVFSHYGQEFEAYPVQDDENFFIVDWRDKNGSGNLSTRYILDKQRGTLIISGDSGDCIASWYSPHTPNEVAGYLNDAYYFMQKVQCSSHNYVYHWEDVEADINDIRQEMLKIITDPENGINDDEGNPITEEQCNEDFDKMLRLIYDKWSPYKGCILSDNFEELMSKYDVDWWESAGYGKRLDDRIYLWMYGFQECVKKLYDK